MVSSASLCLLFVQNASTCVAREEREAGWGEGQRGIEEWERGREGRQNYRQRLERRLMRPRQTSFSSRRNLCRRCSHCHLLLSLSLSISLSLSLCLCLSPDLPRFSSLRLFLPISGSLSFSCSLSLTLSLVLSLLLCLYCFLSFSSPLPVATNLSASFCPSLSVIAFAASHVLSLRSRRVSRVRPSGLLAPSRVPG